MSLSWYSISISLQSGGSPFFTGYFSVNTTTNTIYNFVSSSATTVNILKYSTNSYGADYKFVSGNFTFGGTVIDSIPAIDAQYGASEWSIWYTAGDAQPNMSFKSASTNAWYDVVTYSANGGVLYGTTFSFNIAAASAPATIPVVNKNYDITIYDKTTSSNIFTGLIVSDINTNVISSFYNNTDLTTNILAYSGDDNYSDYKLVNSKFTENGTAITSIPALNALYNNPLEWQIWLYDGNNYLFYKDSSNQWNAIMPLDSTNRYIITVTIVSSNTPCFNIGTKILCLNKMFEEEYVPVQALKKGDIVKTYLQGYRKIKHIGVNRFINNPDDYKSCMYIMKKSKNLNLTEDLIITGEHSILVNYVVKEERIKQRKMLSSALNIGPKQLVMSCISSLFNKITDNNEYTYYHFCVEDDDSESYSDQKYGVWSNGILAEIPGSSQFKDLNLIELK